MLLCVGDVLRGWREGTRFLLHLGSVPEISVLGGFLVDLGTDPVLGLALAQGPVTGGKVRLVFGPGAEFGGQRSNVTVAAPIPELPPVTTTVLSA